MPIPREITPDSMRQWARDLPFANKAVLGRETFELLNAVPKTSLTVGDRMAVLEALNRPVGIVLDHLKSQILGSHPKAPLFLSLGEEYCRRMAASYTGLMNEQADTGSGYFNDRAVVASTVRAGEYHERYLLLRALVHHAPPEGLWDELKTLYMGTKEKHRTAFYRSIALHLCGTNRLAPGKLLQVQKLLESLPVEKLVELKRNAPVGEEPGFYLPFGDAPPSYGLMPADSREISLSRLVTALDKVRTEGIDSEVIQDLYDHWTVAQRNKERRVAPAKPIKTEAIFGFHDLLRCLHSIPDEPAPAAPTTEGKIKQVEAPETVFAAEDRALQTSAVEVLDISDLGCRMSTRRDGVSSGDVVGVKWGAGTWRIGVVAWFVSEGDDWDFGVQWLLENPQPVSLRFDAPDPVLALRGRYMQTGEEVLLHAMLHGSYRATCWVLEEHGWQRSKLHVIERKALVEVARIEHVTDTLAESGMRKPAVAEPVAVEPPKEAAATPFEDVWSALSPYSGDAAMAAAARKDRDRGSKS